MNKIGIIGAMDIEVNGLKAALTDAKVTKKAGMEFHEGNLNGKDVVVVRSGIGKVNAAACTQILADLFNVDAVINTGAAGSLDAAINIGDIVISTDVMHHDMDATIFGYAPGQYPQMDASFVADETLAAKAAEVSGKVNPELQVFRGRVISGDQFISDKNVKERLIETFHGMCTEMEGASIAHVCHLNNIPFVIIRSISDKADDSEMVEYPVFEEVAARHSLKLVEGLMKEL